MTFEAVVGLVGLAAFALLVGFIVGYGVARNRPARMVTDARERSHGRRG
jgi:hypothetical protein